MHCSGKGSKTVITTITAGVYITALHKSTNWRCTSLQLYTISQQKGTACHTLLFEIKCNCCSGV